MLELPNHFQKPNRPIAAEIRGCGSSGPSGNWSGGHRLAAPDHETGFESIPFPNAVFRRKLDMSPGVYRRQCPSSGR